MIQVVNINQLLFSDWHEQTKQILEEQSDQGVLCLQFCLHLLGGGLVLLGHFV